MEIGGPLAVLAVTPEQLTPYLRTDLIPRDDPSAAEMAPQAGLEPAAWSLTLPAASHPPRDAAERLDRRSFKIGSPGRARTCDTSVNSRMLYQLSYWEREG